MKSGFNKNMTALFFLSAGWFANDGLATEDGVDLLSKIVSGEIPKKQDSQFPNKLLNDVLELTEERHVDQLQAILSNKHERPYIMMVINSSGKTQAVLAARFVAKIGKLSRFDRFIGFGSGSIVASLAAINDEITGSDISAIQNLPTNLLVSKKQDCCCSCFRRVQKIFESEHSNEAEELIKLEYDALQVAQCQDQLSALYQNHTIDTINKLTVVTKSNSEILTELVSMANVEKDADSKARIKKLTWDGAIQAAGGVCQVICKVAETKKAKSLEEICKTFQGQQKEVNYTTPQELRQSLDKKGLTKDVVILSFDADTVSSTAITKRPSFNIEHVQNGKSIATLKYHIGIPRQMYYAPIEEIIVNNVTLEKEVDSFLEESAKIIPIEIFLNSLTDI